VLVESIEHAVCQLSALAQEYPGHRVPTMVESCLIEEGVVVDVTKRANIDIALKEQEALFRVTMNAAQVGIFVVQNAVFCFANDFLLNAFGYTAEELINNLSPIDLVVPEQRAMLREQMRRRAAGEPGEAYEIAALRKDRELADFDPLTGLPNRRLLRDRFAQLLAAPSAMAGAGADLSRSRSFQAGQRFARPQRRRRIAVRRRAAPGDGGAQGRYPGPPRWRRVHHCLARHPASAAAELPAACSMSAPRRLWWAGMT
jgi:PAS domain S-box-containing protein